MGATGLHVVRRPDRYVANDALADACGGRVGLDGVLADLNRTASFAHAGGPGVAWAFRWDKEDDSTRRWWPQGITTSGDAADGAHRSVVVTTAYRKGRDGANEGSRISVVDLGGPPALRYRHVLLVTAAIGEDGRLVVRPVRAHAGGVVWREGFLHVAATGTGFHSFRLQDIVDSTRATGAFADETGLTGGGRRYLLPLAFTHRARTPEGLQPFRYSFLSLSHGADGGGPGRRLVAGEYARGPGTRRLLAFDLDSSGLPAADESGVAVPRWVEDTGLARMQGAVHAVGTFFVSASNGRRRGRLWTGRPGRWAEVPGGLPRGPEDLTYWPARDQVLTLTEHLGHRLVLAMDRSRLE